MHRTIGWFWLAAILATSPLGIMLAAEDPAELIINPGFSQDANHDGLPDGWSASREHIQWLETQYLSSDYLLASRPGAYVLATQNLRLKPGQRYTLSVTLKGEEGALGGVLLMHGPAKPTVEMPLLWKIEPSARFEQQVTVFTAPDPECRLYLYNVAKKGTIYYDHVSLREGEPAFPVITQWQPAALDRPLGDRLPGERIAWAAPLAGGPLKTFFTLRSIRCLHDVVELAQRIDLDYDVVDTGYLGDQCLSTTGRQAMQRLRAGWYNVYVIPSRINPILVKTISARVAEGAGLVVLEGFGQGSKFLKAADWKPVDQRHPLYAGIPWDLMPEKILKAIEVGTLGKGRVVRLLVPSDVGRIWGLLPSANTMAGYQARQCEYWEWWQALLAKTMLWAAQRERPAEIEAQLAGPDELVLHVAGAAPGGIARVIVRSGREIRFDAPLLRMPPRELPLDAHQVCSIRLPVAFPAGPVIADVALLTPEGAVWAWSSLAVSTPQVARIVELSTDRPTYEPTGTVRISAKLSAERPAAAVIEARLVDAFGRRTAESQQNIALEAGEQQVQLRLPIGTPLSVLERVIVRVLIHGREQDSRCVPILVPAVGPALAARDFMVLPWSPGMTPPAILGGYTARLQELGFNAQFGVGLTNMTEAGLPGGAYIGATGGAFRSEKKSSAGMRPHCPSDPQVIEQYTTAARHAAAEQSPLGLFAVGITDEAFLTHRYQRDEVCFCTHCQERYRQWLRRQYGTLAALNAEWGAAYQDWQAIGGARTEDVRGKVNFAPFVDFRTFMTDVWVDACRTITRAYHEVSPQTPIGHTNTFGAEPFNGNDYWKLATQTGFGWGQEYSEAIKPQAQKAVFDLWQNFVETPEARRTRSTAGPFFNYGWIGYQHTAAAAHYEPWWLALHGARGVSWYAANALAPEHKTSWALVYPDLRLTGYSQAVREALADLRSGCGKLLMEYQRAQPQVALLWSYPSMLVSWCESTGDTPEPNERPGTDSFGSYFRSALDFRQHVNELQLDYQYLAPPQITTSDALAKFPVLFLPFTVAAESALSERLERYLSAGGVLVADLRALRTDEHGKPFAGRDPLKRLFGVARSSAQINYAATKVRFTARGAGLDLVGRELAACGRESLVPAGATPLAAHASGEPAVLVREHGKGLSVYFNFRLPEYDIVARELIAQILARAGVERPVTVEAPSGDIPPRCYERNTFTRGPVTIEAFIRDQRRCSDTAPVRIRFGRESHLYDIRAAKYLGHTATVTTTLAPGETALYACLSYRVSALEVSAAQGVAPGETLRLSATLRAAGADLGDHVLHVELCDPAGQAVWHYTRNELAVQGKLSLDIRLALNETPGRWSLRVRDVLTGTTAQAAFTVLERPR